jgi:hypothetical protein
MGAGAYIRLASVGCTFPSQNSRFGTNWLFSHVGDPSPLLKERGIRFVISQRPADGLSITNSNFKVNTIGDIKLRAVMNFMI